MMQLQSVPELRLSESDNVLVSFCKLTAVAVLVTSLGVLMLGCLMICYFAVLLTLATLLCMGASWFISKVGLVNLMVVVVPVVCTYLHTPIAWLFRIYQYVSGTHVSEDEKSMVRQGKGSKTKRCVKETKAEKRSKAKKQTSRSPSKSRSQEKLKPSPSSKEVQRHEQSPSKSRSKEKLKTGSVPVTKNQPSSSSKEFLDTKLQSGNSNNQLHAATEGASNKDTVKATEKYPSSPLSIQRSDKRTVDEHCPSSKKVKSKVISKGQSSPCDSKSAQTTPSSLNQTKPKSREDNEPRKTSAQINPTSEKRNTLLDHSPSNDIAANLQAKWSCDSKASSATVNKVLSSSHNNKAKAVKDGQPSQCNNKPKPESPTKGSCKSLAYRMTEAPSNMSKEGSSGLLKSQSKMPKTAVATKVESSPVSKKAKADIGKDDCSPTNKKSTAVSVHKGESSSSSNNATKPETLTKAPLSPPSMKSITSKSTKSSDAEPKPETSYQQETKRKSPSKQPTNIPEDSKSDTETEQSSSVAPCTQANNDLNQPTRSKVFQLLERNIPNDLAGLSASETCPHFIYFNIHQKKKCQAKCVQENDLPRCYSNVNYNNNSARYRDCKEQREEPQNRNTITEKSKTNATVGEEEKYSHQRRRNRKRIVKARDLRKAWNLQKEE